jgi:hypothetical protein
MAKLSTAESEKFFNTARQHMISAKNDQNDPVTDNYFLALHNYFTSVLAANVALVNGVNELLERLERIELKLKK